MYREDVPTAADARRLGATLGLDGEALDLFTRAGAAARHSARIKAAEEALIEGGRQIVPLAPLAGALLLKALDERGVGGHMGLGEGEHQQAGTARVPHLSALGKGRKKADDGGAWDSAIRAALPGSTCEIRPGDGHGLLALLVNTRTENPAGIVLGEESIAVPVARLLDAGLALWLAAYAGTQLLAGGSDARAWGRIYNAARAAHLAAAAPAESAPDAAPAPRLDLDDDGLDDGGLDEDERD